MPNHALDSNVDIITGQPAVQKTSPGLFIVIGSILCLFIGLMYHFQGTSTVQVADRDSRSLWDWFWHVWNVEVFDTSHGPLIPFVAGFLVWWNRKKIAAQPMGVTWAAMIGVVGALFLHWVGMRGAQPRLSVISLILLVWSLACLFIGWRRAKYLIFPASILVFMIPFNFLEQPVSFPLRMFVTDISVRVAEFFNIPIKQVGSQIFDTTGRFQYDVAAPCSGIRSLTTLLCIGAVFGYLTQESWWKRAVLFFSAIPLAVIGNVVRVTLILFVSHWFGQGAGMKVHDQGGIVLFIVVLLCLFGVGSLLDWTRKESRAKKKAKAKP
jgi:exosortase